MEIKLDALSLFLILLFVLVFSTVFMRYFSDKSEGFVSFQESAAPLTHVNIPQYSSTQQNIVKIYDNLFLDTFNGNLIEVDSTTYGNVTDVTGSTISGIWVGSRYTTSTTNYKTTGNVTQDTPESKFTFVNSMKPFVYVTKSSQTNTSFVMYVPYNDLTFLHTITASNNAYKNSNSIYFNHTSLVGASINDNNSISMGSLIADNDKNNGTLVIFPAYDNKKVFQLSHNAYFDPSNGDFIMASLSGTTSSFNVYDRHQTDITTSYKNANQTSIPNIDNYVSWKIYDILGNKMFYYDAVGQKTVITVVEKTSDNTSFQIANVYRFDQNGNYDTIVDLADSKDTSTDNKSKVTRGNVVNLSLDATIDATKDTIPPALDKDSISNYYKWYWYWNTTGGSDMTSKKYSDDYLLKTQIVPPVCPSCPMCPSGGNCSNCNVIGGSGINQTGNVIAQGQGYGPNSAGGVVNNAINTTGNLLYNTGSGITRVGEDAIGGAVGLGAGALGGAVGLGAGALGGAVGLGSQALGGAVGLGSQAIGGTVGLANNAITGLTSNNPVQINDAGRSGYNNSYGGQGQVNQSSIADPYSYYGARPPTGNVNYMPVTADFSKFGR